MYTLLIIISIIISFLLVVVVLLQSSKGEGLAGIAGGSSGFGTVFGSRRTADFLSRITWWLGGLLLGLAILINLYFLPGQTTVEQRKSIIQSSQQQSAPTEFSLPETPKADINTENTNSEPKPVK